MQRKLELKSFLGGNPIEQTIVVPQLQQYSR
jgi:hypothetical protein